MNPSPVRSTQQILRDCTNAVQSASIRDLTFQGWDQLQERNQEGSVIGVRAYTPEAIESFQAAYRVDHVNIQLVHHLAIATHALAWDLELDQDPRAADCWKEAMGYWREVVASPEFWDGLKTKYRSLFPDEKPAGIDTTFIDQVRHSLLEDLLDIHVEFVRYWTEKEISDQCQAHLDIIRSALLPPAVKKQFAGKVYEILTTGVSEACATQAYASALTSLERFLELFPDYLPALRQVAEVCNDWLAEKLSYLDHWDEIYRLGARIMPAMQFFAHHPEINQDPLARPKIEDLATECTRKGYNRGRKYGTANRETNQPPESVEEASISYQFAVDWGRLGLPFSPRGSSLRDLLSTCLNNMAVLVSSEVSDIKLSPASARTIDRAIRKIYLQAIEYMDEAIEVDGEKPIYIQNREIFSSNLTEVELRLSQDHLSNVLDPFSDFLDFEEDED